MKTKLIILGLLVSSLGFGQILTTPDGAVSTPIDTTSLSNRIDAIVAGAVDTSVYQTVWGTGDSLTKYVTKVALVDSAFTVAGDLTGFLTGADTASLDSRISAIDVSAYVAKTDLVDSAFVVAGDITNMLEWSDTTAVIATAYDLTQVEATVDTTTTLATQYYVGQRLDTLSFGFDEVTALDTIVGVQDGAMAVLPFDTDAIVVWSDTTSVIATQYDLTTVSGMSEGTVAGMINDSLDARLSDVVALADSSGTAAGSYVTGYDFDTQIKAQLALSDTMLYLAAVVGLGNAVDTTLFSLNDVIWGVKWGGDHSLKITKVTGVVYGTSPDIDIALLYDDNFRDATPTEVLSADLTITSTTTGSTTSSMSNATVAPDKWLWVRVDQRTAQPTQCIINIYGHLIE